MTSARDLFFEGDVATGAMRPHLSVSGAYAVIEIGASRLFLTPAQAQAIRAGIGDLPLSFFEPQEACHGVS